MSIEIRNIRKNFGTFQALKNVTLDVPSGELVALLGPSGCGKTTLLRIISGLEVPDSGQILFHGEDTTDQHVRERKVGFVFQHYALFRHMTVFDNVAFGLQVKPRKERPSKDEIRSRVYDLLKLVQLDWLADHYPAELSGGQRQRIALARALAVEPKVLLLDEPFGALDANVRKDLRRWLRRLHDEMHITSVFVTHDQEEALEVSDRVVVMNAGRIEQVGTPDEVYDHPANPFVYDFLGSSNQFHGRAHQGRVSIGEIETTAPEYSDAQDLPVVAYVRPHEIEISRTGIDGGIEVRLLHKLTVGALVRLELERLDNGGLVEVELSKGRYLELDLQENEKVFVKLTRQRIFAEHRQVPHQA
ncbi:MAG: sulfate ABC transporter ATP-binding protein [Gammaproteobacteria bacterium]